MAGCHTIICWENVGPLDALETFDSSFSISSCIETSKGQATCKSNTHISILQHNSITKELNGPNQPL